MAKAAWSDSARTSAIWGAVKASTVFENVPSAPNTSSPAVSGATTIERMPISSTNESVVSAWTNRSSAT